MAEWFAPKRHGMGAGLPIAWQGWVVLIAYGTVVGGALLLLGERSPAILPIVLTATALLLLIASRTTKGGWRWRWGKED